MYWRTERPLTNGWYLWKRARTINDPASYRALYVELDYVGMDCWEGGTIVEPPRGGWWFRVLEERS